MMFEYKIPTYSCPTCGRESHILPGNCLTCAWRQAHLGWYRPLLPGEHYTLINIDPICGRVTVNENGTFNFNPTEVLVESADETEEAFFLFVKRTSDGQRFRINATKPGPWENYPVAEPVR